MCLSIHGIGVMISALKHIGTTELTFAILQRLSVYWKKIKKEKKGKISLIEHIHPRGQTATVMNTALSENYSVLYPAVVEDEKKGPGRRVCTDTHTEPRKKWRANVQLGKQNPWSR